MEELIEILEVGLSPADIVELLNQFNQDELNKYAVKHNICPDCYRELRLHTWKENRGEHFGFPAHETLSELRCDSCGWS